MRLKGGDPFVFGRGGEELETLARGGAAFEEIPGVTSAIAAAAYGGIPVTHRDYASSLHIVTGHAREGAELDIDFEALVRTGGTLLFLMGVTALPAIAEGLLEAGMDPDTPAAMVERGTLPGQRRCSATLGTLRSRAEEMEIHSPALIIVGGVCALAEALCACLFMESVFWSPGQGAGRERFQRSCGPWGQTQWNSPVSARRPSPPVPLWKRRWTSSRNTNGWALPVPPEWMRFGPACGT